MQRIEQGRLLREIVLYVLCKVLIPEEKVTPTGHVRDGNNFYEAGTG